MKRSSPILIALGSAALTSLALLTAPAADAAGPAYYAAKPVTTATTSRMVVRDTLWKCSDAGCASAIKGSSRAAFICESLVKEVGALASFRAGTDEFGAEALAKCNAKA